MLTVTHVNMQGRHAQLREAGESLVGEVLVKCECRRRSQTSHWGEVIVARLDRERRRVICSPLSGRSTAWNS